MENGFSCSIVGIGHPLLDLIAEVPMEFLQKYELKTNNAILASGRHENLCRELIENFPVKYVPGGSIQNTIRVAQWFFNEPEVGVIFGCIGDDDLGKEMKQNLNKERVKAVFMVDQSSKTGTCACLITGECRSLVSFLGASNSLNVDDVEKNKTLITSAKIIYTSGFLLASNPKLVFLLAEIVDESKNGKTFAFNLSAAYVVANHSKRLLGILPFVDILFGNENEALTLANALGWQEKDLDKICLKLANLNGHHRRKLPRIVVITQGPGEVYIGERDQSSSLRYPVPKMNSEEILDTNGSGDAFVGGFLAYHLLGYNLDQCLKMAVYAAQKIIRHSGCTLPEANEFKL